MVFASTTDDLLRQMSADPWFGRLDVHERRIMLSDSDAVSLQVGGYVFRQGDEPNGFYGLVNGVLKASTLREDGKEAILAVIEPGAWFGEASVIDGMPRTHDVMALAPSNVLRMHQHHFDELMQRSTFARALAQLQSARMRAVYAMIEDATLRSTRARIARRLHRLAQGDATPGSAERHEVVVTQDNLAMMLGITRQTLALELKAMVSHGAISVGYGRIEIASLEKLRELEVESSRRRGNMASG